MKNRVHKSVTITISNSNMMVLLMIPLLWLCQEKIPERSVSNKLHVKVTTEPRNISLFWPWSTEKDMDVYNYNNISYRMMGNRTESLTDWKQRAKHLTEYVQVDDSIKGA